MVSLEKIFRSLPAVTALKSRVSASQVEQRFASGVFWTLTGNLTWRGLSAISTIIIARILGPEHFGEFGMIQSTVNLFAVYAAFRLGTTATKYVAEYRKSNPQKASRILHLTLRTSFILCTVVALTLFVFSDTLATQSLKHPELSVPLSIGAFFLFFFIYSTIHEHALAGFESFKKIAKLNILRGLLIPLICIPSAFYGGVIGAISGLTVVSCIILAATKKAIKQEKRNLHFPDNIPFGQLKSEIPILWKFALPGFMTGILITSSEWFGRLMLTQNWTGYKELGLFVAANQWRIFILFLPAVLARIVLPILSETHSRNNNEFNTAISLQLQTISLITLPLTILIIGFSGPLASLFGSQFSGTESVIPVLMLSVYFFALNQAVRQVFDSTGNRWKNLLMHLGWASVYFFACIKLIPQFGAVGLAYAYGSAEITLFLFQSCYADIILTSGALRKHYKIFVFSLLLLLTSLLMQLYITDGWRESILTLLFLFSLFPVYHKFRTILDKRKNSHASMAS